MNHMNLSSVWICPHCRQPLEAQGGAFVCAGNHTFDRAKEGYVNLLAGHQKSGPKGDSPDMLAARRRFLEAGYYAPLRARLSEIIAGTEHASVAEIGCGEGYYIGGISEHSSDAMCFGTDIAKDGIRLAAKRYKQVRFAVADTNKIVPLPDSSADVLVDIFAPRNASEFARVLRPGSRLIVVIPTQRHLAKLREVQPLLAIQQHKRRLVQDSLAGFFALAVSEVLEVPLVLDGAAVSNLVHMTPNAWFLTDAQRQTLADIEAIKVLAEFEILQFEMSAQAQ
jgi:23S rRNA (guanine745-N1)-methyltransferase